MTRPPARVTQQVAETANWSCHPQDVLGLTQLPQLVAEGVTLRPFLDSDQDLVLEVATDPYIPTITTVPATADPATAAAFIHRQHARLTDGAGFSFAIADAGTDEPLGQMGLWPISDSGRASTGYWIAARHRGRGHPARPEPHHPVRQPRQSCVRWAAAASSTSPARSASRSSPGRGGGVPVTGELSTVGRRPGCARTR